MCLSESQLDKVESILEDEVELDEALNRALLQVRDGKVIPHNEVRKKYEKWL